MSAGVVIAPDNYPMYFLEQMAAALLRSAKRLAREKKEGCIDFLFLRGQSTMGTDPLAFRQRMLERSLDSRTRLLFHERPYTVDDLDKIVKFAQQFVDHDFPRSRLYGLRQALDVGREHATLFFLYQLARSSKDQQELLMGFQAEFMARSNSVVPWNQKREDGQVIYSTPLVDLVDVCDLLKKEP
jgi:CRISPR-associated protein Cmr2